MAVRSVKLSDIEHIEFYVPDKRMSITQAYNTKKYNGRKCDLICNGTLFDMGSQSKSTITYGAVGGSQIGFLFCNYGIILEGNKVRYGTLQDAKDNNCDLVGSAPLIVKDKKVVSEWGNRKPSTSVTGNHIRTAIGISDNEFVMYTSSDEISLTTLASRMIGYGCHTSCNLDGGGSTSMIETVSGNMKYVRNTSRLLANFVMIWVKKDNPQTEKDDDEMVTKSKIIVNGIEKECSVIMKDNTTYVKLRDISDSQIVVDYDGIKKMAKVDVKK